LDAVIGLPANVFYGTSIPTCILVLSKCRVHNDDILFIDASQGFEKDGNKNRLSEKHIEAIIDTYHTRSTNDKFSYVATLDEVADNDYNLNIPRYVDTFEEEEQIDLEAVASELALLEKDIAETDSTIADFCQQLNLKPPF
jgi:type I restriction enzyme M protein